MGTLAKRLGQLAARSVESESSNIIKNVSANKHGLSKMLDSTLKESHDMRVFGLGTASSMANRDRYARFTASMHAVYSEMEGRLDSSTSAPVKHVWASLGPPLRRAEALRLDLLDVAPEPPALTPATSSYVATIAEAARKDDLDGGGRLLGHLYCRYLADLFGGQALAAPYRWALALPAATPRHYDFGEFGARRRESIESIYVALNEAGEILGPQGDAARENVVAEARDAFRMNVLVYAEEGGLYSDGARGIANVVGGFLRDRLA